MQDRSKKDFPYPRASAAPALNAGAEATVRQLIANGKYKVAVETAKEIHKAQGTAMSEALLVDAYSARIQSLIDRNLGSEAAALINLVRERYPSARERLLPRNASGEIGVAAIEELVQALNNPDLSAERRAGIETVIAREVGDLSALSECAALNPEHPLRKAASALHRAFLAVTEGPVAPEALELPEVSRRSPLACWKLLIRAIACFHRGEDEPCRRYLEAIKPETAPARLVPAMQAMLGGKPARLTPAAATLVSSTKADSVRLRRALEELDKAFDSHKEGTILRAVPEAIQACNATAASQIERLKQHISVRCALAEVDAERVKRAMGGASCHDAYFKRLLARGMEELGDPPNLALACATWDDFRRDAVREGWFTSNGPEAATLYLHMAGVLRKLPHEVLERLQTNAGRQNQKNAEELYFLYPEKLYERACALDAHSESFSQWLEWAKGRRRGNAERVAEAWHKARPLDIEPILLLMEEKEKRSAFHSSLQYLTKAERIDSVNPAVRRARLRLLAGSIMRHLQQKRPDLAEEKLTEIEDLAQARQGDRPAFVAALRYVVCAARSDAGGAAARRAEAERVLGSRAGAALLIFGVATASKQAAIEHPPAVEALGKSERAALPEAVIRVVDLARDMQMSQPIPRGWLEETAKQFPRVRQSLDLSQLQILGETALQTEHLELAYAASSAGLERGGSTEVAFLLLRARILQECTDARWAVCAAAAAKLAQEQRQTAIIEQAVELLTESPFDDLSLTAGQASAVLQEEKRATEFPSRSRPGPDYREFLGGELCMCPACRRAREEGDGPFDDFDDEEDDDLDSMFGPSNLPPGMSPEIAQILFEETRRAVERGESLESLLNRMFGSESGFGRRKDKRRR